MDLVTKKKLKKALRFSSYGALILFILLICNIIYRVFFLPYDLMYKNGVNNFPELLELSKQTEPSNDPFLTSEVLPDHPLYSALLAKQRSQLSNPLWEPLLDENNADAMYWYAMNNMAGVNGRALSGAWLVQSAKLGNPYAAFYLRKDSYDCQLKIAHLCDDKWRDRAIELFKERIAEGDIKARYYYVYGFGKMSSQKDTDELVSVTVDAAKQGYYRPLIDFIGRYSKDYGWKDLEDKKKGLQLLMMAANDNYAPAIEKVLSMIDHDEEIKELVNYEKLRETIYQQSFLMGLRGGTYGALVTAVENFELDESDVNKAIMNTYGCFRFILFDSTFVCNDLSEDEREVAMESAQLLVDKIKAPIYIDELHFTW